MRSTVLTLAAVSFAAVCAAAPPAADQFSPASPTGDQPPPPFPKYLGTFSDPMTGSRITRVTGDSGTRVPNTDRTWEGRTRSVYSTKQVWSSDEKLLYLEVGGPLVLDGETYHVLHDRGPPHPATWHPTRPDVMLYVTENTVGEWNALNTTTRVLATIEGYRDFVQSESVDWVSADGRFLGVTATRARDEKDVGFLIDLATGMKATPDFVYADHGFARKERSHQSCRPSLSGKSVVLSARGGDDNGNPRGEAFTVFDLTGSEVGRHWEYPHTPGHGDLALDADGNDLMVGRSDDGWPERPEYFGMVGWRFVDGQLQPLGPAGSHTSGLAVRKPGWVFTGDFGPGSTVFMVNLDGSGETRVVCRTWHTEPVDYWAQTQPVPSPTGTRVLFATNWGQTRKAARRGHAHSFVADLRDKR